MRESLRNRTVIIGNGGAGKSVFAARLSAQSGIPPIHLDPLHWEGPGYGRKREPEAAKALVRQAVAAPQWVLEGVYGWLAAEALPRATGLVWLDLPWAICREGLIARGRNPEATEADFTELLAWAEAYSTRETSSSYRGHLQLFESFAGEKFRLRSREAADALLADGQP